MSVNIKTIDTRVIPTRNLLEEDFISRNGPREEAVKQAGKKRNDRKQVDGENHKEGE